MSNIDLGQLVYLFVWILNILADLKLNPTNQHKNGTCSQHYPQGISSVTAVADPIIPTGFD